MKLNKKLNGNQINNYTFFWKIACHKLETLLFPPISKKLVKKVVLWLKLQQCGPCWLVIGAQQTRLKRTPCKFTNHRRLMRPFFSKSQQQLIHTTHTCTLALVSFTDQLTIAEGPPLSTKNWFFRSAKIAKKCVWGETSTTTIKLITYSVKIKISLAYV